MAAQNDENPFLSNLRNKNALRGSSSKELNEKRSYDRETSSPKLAGGKKPSLLSIFVRKSSSVDQNNPKQRIINDDQAPPISPIFPPSDDPKRRTVGRLRRATSSSLREETYERRDSIHSQGGNLADRFIAENDDPDWRERSASQTSIDSMYSYSARVNDITDFNVSNPIHLSGALPYSLSRKQSSVTEVDLDQAKRESLLNCAVSNVNQSKLLERRRTRTRKTSMDSLHVLTHNNMVDSLEESNANSSYEREAASASSVSSYSKRAFGSHHTEQKESESPRSASSPFGIGRLRAKWAKSRLRYSDRDVREFPDAGTAKQRAAELRTFFAKHPIKPKITNGADRVEFLLERYTPEALALPLYQLFTMVPDGWESFLPIEIQEAVERSRSQSSFDQDRRLVQNMQELMGESTFVAADQIAKFQQVHKVT